MDYKEYQKECKRIRKDNKKLISNFKRVKSSFDLSILIY